MVSSPLSLSIIHSCSSCNPDYCTLWYSRSYRLKYGLVDRSSTLRGMAAAAHRDIASRSLLGEKGEPDVSSITSLNSALIVHSKKVLTFCFFLQKTLGTTNTTGWNDSCSLLLYLTTLALVSLAIPLSMEGGSVEPTLNFRVQSFTN